VSIYKLPPDEKKMEKVHAELNHTRVTCRAAASFPTVR